MPKLRYRKKKPSSLITICGAVCKWCMNVFGIGLFFGFLILVFMILYGFIVDVTKIHYIRTESTSLAVVSAPIFK